MATSNHNRAMVLIKFSDSPIQSAGKTPDTPAVRG